jgi:ADP-ribose pyrophosphatase
MYEAKKMRLEKLTFSKKGTKETHSMHVLNFAVPRSVAILPITESGNVILEKHFRYVMRTELLEMPAGWVEMGEKPIQAARRELKEETGFTTSRITELGSMIPSSGYSNEHLFLFLAKVYESSKSYQALEKGEEISLVSFSKERVLKMIKDGEIIDPMTICAVFRALLRGLFA